MQVPALSGTGVFLNPWAWSTRPVSRRRQPDRARRVHRAVRHRPGDEQADRDSAVPGTLNGVTVTINGKAAPLYFVSASQINALVPYSTTGPTATIVVQNNGANSNTVTVPLAATSPGVFTLDQSGSGGGAILHADFAW